MRLRDDSILVLTCQGPSTVTEGFPDNLASGLSANLSPNKNNKMHDIKEIKAIIGLVIKVAFAFL